MLDKVKTREISKVLVQRNVCFGVIAVQMISIIILSFTIYTKDIMYIIQPMGYGKTWWVRGNQVDPECFEYLATNFVRSHLTVSPTTVDAQIEQNLSFVHPSSNQKIKEQWLKEAKELKFEGVSTTFLPIPPAKVDVDNLTAVVTGWLVTHMDGVNDVKNKKSYKVVFYNHKGATIIKEFKEIKHD